MKKGIIKALQIMLNVLIGTIIAIAAIVTIVTLSTKEKGVADVNGYIPFSIQSESMTGTIDEGDLIITKRYEHQVLKKGDIISFFSAEQDTTIIKTHRIIEVNKEGDLTSYTTKGDYNSVADDVKVAPGDIVSVYTGTRLEHVGSLLDFFKSRYGFLLCIILPIFVFFLYQLYSFVSLIVEIKKAKVNE